MVYAAQQRSLSVFNPFQRVALATSWLRHHAKRQMSLGANAGSTTRRGLSRMYTLYSMQRSGNSYKARLALAVLGASYRLVEVDILRGESRTPDFLKKNPSGQVPLLEVAPGRFLAESNAIVWYVAGGTPLAPDASHDRDDP